MRPLSLKVMMAYQFYIYHIDLFNKIFAEDDVSKRTTSFSADAFDDWAVKFGYMKMRLVDAEHLDDHERGSVMLARRTARCRVSEAARKGLPDMFPAYSVEALDLNGSPNYQIMAVDHYADTRPQAIVGKVGRSLKSARKADKLVKALVIGHNEISEEVRISCLGRLAIAEENIVKWHCEVIDILDVLKKNRD